MSQLAMFLPKSSWRPPKEFPDLSSAEIISFDVETCDPHLMSHGPGGVKKDGKLVGISVKTESFCGYFPFGHEGGDNLDKDKVLAWAKKTLGGNAIKVGANILYDLEWLRAYGIEVNGPLRDIQVAEPLMNEELDGGYSLAALSKRYLGIDKEETLLREAATVMGLNPKGELWKLPARYVGPYAEADAELPYKIWQLQEPKLQQQDLWPIFELESRLIPVILNMRFRGVKIDMVKAEKLNKELLIKEATLLRELRKECGMVINPWSGDDLKKAFNSLNIWHPTTAKGNPSFISEWLMQHEHPFARKVVEYRKTNKMRKDFIEGVCLEQSYNGRIYSQFHQLRKDTDGTRTGRFSSSTPNLQQIPSRDSYWGPLVRSLFLPDDGKQWACMDYSQQEPRILLHYADLRNLRGIKEVVEEFNSDDQADFHRIVSEMAGIPRKEAKTINLAMFYGMGIFKLAQKLEMEMNDAKSVFEQYHNRVPFVRRLAYECSNAASRRGFVKTILGRKRHFDMWEPSDARNIWPNKKIPLNEEAANKVWTGRPLRRSFTHKALNALIQGSAADMMKQAMLDLAENGIIPQVIVHDEIDFSFESSSELNLAKEVMENCIKLAVPLKVDVETGPNWGEIK